MVLSSELFTLTPHWAFKARTEKKEMRKRLTQRLVNLDVLSFFISHNLFSFHSLLGSMSKWASGPLQGFLQAMAQSAQEVSSP